MIQQHDATRLHWDLRLEHDGVLRSWALPRGIPWSPDENRLAVATEDHSLDFLDYEGDAADVGYGAGRMTNWDRGTYEAHKMEADKVVITLSGTRASGKYALFSMRGGRNWLIHRMDPPHDDRRVSVPIGVRPMRGVDGDLPDTADWVYERRWNGIRTIVTNDTGRVVITDDSGDDVSVKFPEVRRIARALGHLEVILDGVVVPIDPSGTTRSDRRGLDRRMRITSDSGARNASRTAPVVFMATDIIWLEGRPLAAQPWELRRRQLDDLRLDGPGWKTSPILTLIEALEMRAAIIAKRRDSVYRIGAVSPDWISSVPT